MELAESKQIFFILRCLTNFLVLQSFCLFFSQDFEVYRPFQQLLVIPFKDLIYILVKLMSDVKYVKIIPYIFFKPFNPLRVEIVYLSQISPLLSRLIQLELKHPSHPKARQSFPAVLDRQQSL